jgi:hypothetical protein
VASAQAPAGEEASGQAQAAKDAKLEKKIDSRLEKDKGLKKHGLDAAVLDGNVTLTGTVNSDAEKARAEKLAQTKGVSSVDNQIEVLGAAQEGAAPPAGEGAAPPPAGEQGAASPAPGEEQQAQPQGTKVEERSTRVEETTETRVEPSQPQQQQQPEQQAEPQQQPQPTTTPPPSPQEATPPPSESEASPPVPMPPQKHAPPEP